MNSDFGELTNAPISTGYFEFKSEKSWDQKNIFKQTELFTIDIQKLSTLCNCIPFNTYIEVKDEYFTKDQLTLFNSVADEAKKILKVQFEEKKAKVLSDTNETHCKKSIDDDDDLDFLLTLKEPVRQNIALNMTPRTIPITQISQLETNVPKIKNHSSKPKSIDLEKWLESVLDD